MSSLTCKVAQKPRYWVSRPCGVKLSAAFKDGIYLPKRKETSVLGGNLAHPGEQREPEEV